MKHNNERVSHPVEAEAGMKGETCCPHFAGYRCFSSVYGLGSSLQELLDCSTCSGVS